MALAELLRTRPDVVARLVPDLAEPGPGGLRDLMQAMALGARLGDETAALNKVLRRTRSLDEAARSATDPALALAYLQAADKVIQVDDFDGPGTAADVSRAPAAHEPAHRRAAGARPQRTGGRGPARPDAGDGTGRAAR